MKPLSHFSFDKIERINSVEQPADLTRFGAGGFGKPLGLWVSCDGPQDWPEWCKAEKFRNTEVQLRYRINLKAGANILYITDTAGMYAFTEKYGYEYARYLHAIDWLLVSKDYDGIIIPHYLWGCRLDSKITWYYGWDCASGCIWNADAVESIQLLNQERVAA